MRIFDKIVAAIVFAALPIAAFSVQPLAFTLNHSSISPAPTPTPKPTPKPRPSATPTPTPTPKPSAIPTPKPTASPTPTPVQSLAELQSKIRQRMFAPEVRRGRVGIKIVSLNSGKVIFENDSDKYFMPASNMKNFTVAAAIERLGPDFRFVTSVYANAMPDAAGTIKGDLRIFGRGDISISTAFFGTSPTDPETYYKGIDRLVERIVASGVKRIEGSIIGDERYFSGDPVNGTWEVEDMESPDGAEMSALPLNDNAIDISVKPGTVGNPCSVKISPLNTIMRVVNRCVTSSAGIKRDLRVVKLVNQNVLQATGSMPVGDAEYKDSIAITHPAELFIELLRQRLLQKGVTITGPNSVVTEMTGPICPTCPTPPGIEIAKLESPPFSLISAKTMKRSQNMYTETILWTMGEQSRLTVVQPAAQDGANGPLAKRPDSATLGLGVVKNFLKEVGVATDGIIQYDGSGMSRRDLMTPAAVIQLYTYMAKQSKYSQVWRDALAIGGVDGTLRNRFIGTLAAGNLRGKTGTLSQVSALSGYITTAGGEQLVISIIVNGVPETRLRTSLADDIVVNLANFNGKID